MSEMEITGNELITRLTEENRQLQKDLMTERVVRIDIQMQLLAVMRQEAAGKFQELEKEAKPENQE
jgi:hypothetical protein